MALSLKHPEVDRLARELASRTGETLTEAILNALKERLRRELGRLPGRPRLRDEIRAIRRRCAELPIRDRRSTSEILGYDETGLPR